MHMQAGYLSLNPEDPTPQGPGRFTMLTTPVYPALQYMAAGLRLEEVSRRTRSTPRPASATPQRATRACHMAITAAGLSRSSRLPRLPGCHSYYGCRGCPGLPRLALGGAQYRRNGRAAPEPN